MTYYTIIQGLICMKEKLGSFKMLIRNELMSECIGLKSLPSIRAHKLSSLIQQLDCLIKKIDEIETEFRNI